MGKVFTHPGQPQMQVEVILASQGPHQRPVYTIRMRYPRIIHAEIMTHRMFCRNARSSRAVPVKTMLLECTPIPFVPWHWGKNQKGMQAGEECDAEVHNWTESFRELTSDEQFLSKEDAWLLAADMAVRSAEAFMEAGYHKQLANRILEPYTWIDTLITATDWANFLWLRDHKDAEPHLQDLARLVKQAIEAAEIQQLEPGEWHLPYITDEDVDWAWENINVAEEPYNDWLCKISAARCARISYAPFDGDASYERELDRYNQLVTSDRVHASPLEHQCFPDTLFQNWEEDGWQWDNPHLHGPLTGYIQFRKTIPNEAVHG